MKDQNYQLFYFISLMLIFLGIAWRHDIETKEYYIDGHSGIPIVGEDGIIRAYAAIIGGICVLIYGIYLTYIKVKE